MVFPIRMRYIEWEFTVSLWRHDIETRSALLTFCEENPPVTGGFPSQRASNAGFDVTLTLVFIKYGTNNLVPGDLRRHKHDDVIKWKHFPRYWPFVRGIHQSPVNSSHKGQWRGALMFSLICVWINGWVNNCEAGDFRRHLVHYDVTIMKLMWYHCIINQRRSSEIIYFWCGFMITNICIQTNSCISLIHGWYMFDVTSQTSV